MKNAQSTVEYVLCMVMFALICILIAAMWNRSAVIQGGTFGVEVNNSAVHVRPMTN